MLRECRLARCMHVGDWRWNGCCCMNKPTLCSELWGRAVLLLVFTAGDEAMKERAAARVCHDPNLS
eukprot:3450659-Karenia_brevis.AAC.1